MQTTFMSTFLFPLLTQRNVSMFLFQLPLTTHVRGMGITKGHTYSRYTLNFPAVVELEGPLSLSLSHTHTYRQKHTLSHTHIKVQ